MATIYILFVAINLWTISTAYFVPPSSSSGSTESYLIPLSNIEDSNSNTQEFITNNMTGEEFPKAPNDSFQDINANETKSLIFATVLQNYDKNIRPIGLNGSGPVEVEVNLYVRSIENIDDVRMEYKVQLTFRQEWIDKRLKYSHLHENIYFLQMMTAYGTIWAPDLFFSNEKQGVLHKLMVPNVFTRIYPNGRVTQSFRISLLLSCTMNLQSYPLDEQLCPIRMASYGWTTDDILLSWRRTNPVQMAREFHMARFKLKKHATVLCESRTTTGVFGCLQLKLTFAREFGFYMIQIYVPCSMLVIVSWVSFFLEPTAVEARVSLGVTTILTIVTQTYGINLSAPPASYIKALDVWTATCQAMIFGAILQFAYVNYILHFQWKHPLEKYNVHVQEDMQGKKNAFMKAKRVDRFSRVIFPLTFTLFNVAYWTGYLVTDFTNIPFDKLAVLTQS